ncbi:AAA family ATPase [Burkholderia ubonensis]|uniref:AAA family ATPase n=1 Tax=Burkholderia ubonensis TaxID=101571 RepID=UPI00075E8223|nr:ATP-binding protein [Burkholderia ubonensis]KWC05389.1 DNA-binding protein [Burkholderia ubonensis]KWO71080.1 DNA-binding protein [Burkholderia ubonensis]
MTIEGFDKQRVRDQIKVALSAAQPVRTPEKLKGRERELEDIDRALSASGRNIFIYGDRGVGKSSLGVTAAHEYQSSDNMPIIVGGSPNETFNSIIANIANQAIGYSRTTNVKKQSSISLEWRGLKWQLGREVSAKDVKEQLRTIGDAVDLLREVARVHSKQPVVVIDEFDTIPEAEERSRFAALLKALGDREVDLKFIFTGVGRSLEELLGAHQSAYRQLATFEVHRLGWEARREIVTQAAQEFGLDVDNDVNWRIAIVSDGFPHYVHLITEHMIWQAFDDDADCDVLGQHHYQLGLRKAIEQINVELKRPYEKAVLHRQPEWEDLVWATADGEDLTRQSKDIQQSYESIIERRKSPVIIENGKFAESLRRLKGENYGAVLEAVPQRQGWYTYREKMLRGFVRMQAEASGIELNGEVPLQRQRMHVPANMRSGYHEARVPSNIRLRDDRKN